MEKWTMSLLICFSLLLWACSPATQNIVIEEPKPLNAGFVNSQTTGAAEQLVLQEFLSQHTGITLSHQESWSISFLFSGSSQSYTLQFLPSQILSWNDNIVQYNEEFEIYSPMQIASFIGKYHIPTSSLQALYFFDEGGNPLMELEITPLDKVFPLEETKFSFFYKNDDGVCNYKSTDGSVFTQKQKDIQGIKNTLIFHTTDWKQWIRCLEYQGSQYVIRLQHFQTNTAVYENELEETFVIHQK